MDQVIMAAFNMHQERSVFYAKPKTMKGVLAAFERLIENPNVHVISTRIIRDPREPQQTIDSFTDDGGVAVLSSDPQADMDKGFVRVSKMRKRRTVSQEEI